MINRSLLLAAFAIAAIGPAHAEYFTHYQINMTGPLAVDGIVKWEKDANGTSISWPDFIDGGFSVNHIDQIFGSSTPRTSAFFMGMAYDGQFDPVYFATQDDLAAIPIENKHVVFFMSNGAAAAALSDGTGHPRSFSAFTGFAESDVIAALEVVGQIGTPPIDETTFDADLDFLSSVVNSLQTTYSAYFAIPPDQNAVSGQFSVVQFSDATLVGTGGITQDNVPEPGTFSSLALAGLGMAAMRCRWRKN